MDICKSDQGKNILSCAITNLQNKELICSISKIIISKYLLLQSKLNSAEKTHSK